MKVGSNQKIYMETCTFCAFMFKIYMKAQKHARFYVFTPFSAYCYRPPITSRAFISHSSSVNIIAPLLIPLQPIALHPP